MINCGNQVLGRVDRDRSSWVQGFRVLGVKVSAPSGEVFRVEGLE